MSNGIVYLVGAGPGDAGLITKRGLDCIESAQVIIYDNLVNSALLDYAAEDTEFIYVGKKANAHTMPQEEINRLLVERAAAGLVVVRLKGGDPFVFGRGGEEALALNGASIPFEVVPGVTAGIAASAYAGIPVTHRGVSSAVTFITGHESPDREKSGINWSALAKAQSTLVFYMGVKNLPFIVENLLAEGMAESTEAALIENGTRPYQRVVRGDLTTIVKRACESDIRPPAITVIGPTVGLAGEIDWFKRKPLSGRMFIATREEGEGGLSDRLSELGAGIYSFPVISVVGRPDNHRLHEAIEHLDSYDWLVFTSRNGVKIFFEKLHRSGKDSRALAGCKVAVIGPGTALELSHYGIKADLVPERFVAEDLIQTLLEMDRIEGKRVLIPRSSIGRKLLCEEFKIAGAHVDDIAVYDTLIPTLSRDKIDRVEDMLKGGRECWLCFTSSSTVKHFFHLVDREIISNNRKHVKFISIGPVTSATLKEQGFNCDLEATEFTIDGMIKKLREYFSYN